MEMYSGLNNQRLAHLRDTFRLTVWQLINQATFTLPAHTMTLLEFKISVLFPQVRMSILQMSFLQNLILREISSGLNLPAEKIQTLYLMTNPLQPMIQEMYISLAIIEASSLIL